MVTETVFSLPSRRSVAVVFVPGLVAATLRGRVSIVVIFDPLNSMMTSPRLMPAFCAGLSSNTSATRAPVLPSNPKLLARSGFMRWTPTPSQPLTTLPFVRRSSITRRVMLLGMANPMPWPAVTMAVLMPTTSPSVLSSGPPELPGLMEASV